MSRTWLPPSFLRLAEVLPETAQGCRATRLADVLGQDAGNTADEEQLHLPRPDRKMVERQVYGDRSSRPNRWADRKGLVRLDVWHKREVGRYHGTVP